MEVILWCAAQNVSVVSMEAVSVERSDSARSDIGGPVVEEDKRTPENSVPNIIITCSADDDIHAETNALQMIDAFNLPTVNEVLHSH